MKKKPIIITGIGAAFLMCTGILLYNHTKIQPKKTTEKFTQALVNNDIETILNLMPNTLKNRLIEDTMTTYQIDEKEAVTKAGESISKWNQLLTDLYGEEYSINMSVENTYRYNASDRKDLNTYYQIMDADYKALDAEHINIRLDIQSQSDTSGSQIIPISLVWAGGSWKIGQNLGYAYETHKPENEYDVTGDLLDGFSIRIEETEKK